MASSAGPPVDAGTRLYAVIGHPVAHSLSPLMHNAAFRSSGVNGVYVAFDVTDLPGAIAGLRALEMGGMSVTIPHKVAVMDLLDEVEPAARRIGAVNTIVNQAGRLVGLNSDAPGAMAALLEKGPLAGKRVAVVGAGGAARAVAHGIVQHGGRLTIINRSEANGRRLADELEAVFVPLNAFGADGIDVLINTTSVGMSPRTDRMPVAAECLRAGMTVMDIVYNPLTTRLLRAARAAGCTVVDGAAMFVHQGAIQFEHWTGRRAPVALMKQVVLEALQGRETKDPVSR